MRTVEKMTTFRKRLILSLWSSFLLFAPCPYAGDFFTPITPEEAIQTDAAIPSGLEFTRVEGNGTQIKILSPDLM